MKNQFFLFKKKIKNEKYCLMISNNFIMEPYQNIININDRVTKYGKIIVSILNKYTQKDLSRMDILDIGCGNGFFEFALSKK